MKRFLSFDPLNLPSSRRLFDLSQRQEAAPDLDRTGHSTGSSGRPSDDDEDEKTSSGDDQAESFQVRTKLGQTVYWSSQYHYSTEELEPYRQVGDEEMDDLLELCAGEGAEGAGRFDDIVRLSAEAAESLSPHDKAAASASPARRALADFYNRYSTPPSFVDWEQLQRGIDIFITYAPAAGTSLYYRSLVGGFSIPKITQVLFATRYLAPPSPPEKVKERLMDTGGFLAACFAPVPGNNEDATTRTLPAAAIRPGGPGWAAALRVRHLHARVRRSILQSKTLDWDTEEFGIPINQEDMSATVLAFSVNVLVGIEFIGGRALSEDDQKDYLALWRYLSWLLGVEINENGTMRKSNLPPLDPCSGIKAGGSVNAESDPIAHSYSLLESVIFHLLTPNDISKQVASHLLDIGRNSKKERMQGKVAANNSDNHEEDTASRTFGFQYRAFMCRRNLGEPLANALDLPHPPKFSLMYGVLFSLSSIHLTLMRIYTMFTMHVPFLRTRIYRWHASGMSTFFSAWEIEHNKRMRRANVSDNNGDAEMKGGSACPFALVMQPE